MMIWITIRKLNAVNNVIFKFCYNPFEILKISYDLSDTEYVISEIKENFIYAKKDCITFV